ncbi:MAG: hypothetical protein MUF87_00145 [Anaerolineae bacterium]|jgi:hypothetical protein|nr:hypothetical protein [Anaerolineae bacterium]
MDEHWITQIKVRGLAGIISWGLTILEPFGAFGANLLYVLQPTFGILGWGAPIQDIAQALETPGGIEALQQQLQED